MIVIDTSAIIAILKEEADAKSFAEIIIDPERCFFSAVGFFEASMVLIGRGSPNLADGLTRWSSRRVSRSYRLTNSWRAPAAPLSSALAKGGILLP